MNAGNSNIVTVAKGYIWLGREYHGWELGRSTGLIVEKSLGGIYREQLHPAIRKKIKTSGGALESFRVVPSNVTCFNENDAVVCCETLIDIITLLESMEAVSERVLTKDEVLAVGELEAQKIDKLSGRPNTFRASVWRIEIPILAARNAQIHGDDTGAKFGVARSQIINDDLGALRYAPKINSAPFRPVVSNST